MKKMMLLAIAGMMALGMQAQESQESRQIQNRAEFHQVQKCPNFKGKQQCHKGMQQGMHQGQKMRMDAQSKAMMKAAKLKDELLLNADQCDKVYKALFDNFSKRDAQRQALSKNEQAPSEAEMAAAREEFKKLQNELNGKMKKILNDEQFKKWESLQQNGHNGYKKVHK